MLDDIVQLPRPLSKFRRGETTQSSFCAYQPPDSVLGMQLGITVETKDFPIQIGNEFFLLDGKEAPYRYKLIEHDENYVREYVAISDGPITSRDSKMFTLWMNQTEKDSFKTERFYFWDLIAQARDYFGFQKCDLLSSEVKNTLSLSGVLANYPGLERAYAWSHRNLEPITDEVEELNRLHLLKANLRAMEMAQIGEYWLHPTDVFRGIDFPKRRDLKLKTGSGRILSRNIVAPDDLKKLLGPDYATKPYHMCLRNTEPLLSSAEIDALVEYSGWFDVLKYIELIPYSELFVAFSDKSIEVMRVFDPYDPSRFKDIDPNQIDDSFSNTFVQLREELERILPVYSRGTLYRSWGEEVYITLQTPNRKTKQFYFDMMSAALGSRMFTPSES